MDQEKIGKFIKDLRKKNGLTQEKFANIFGVTYQAVSKWENGKNIPDIAILKDICNKYNVDINSLLEGSTKKKPKKIFTYALICLTFIVLGISLFFAYQNMNNDFEFKTLSSTSDKFRLFGSIAYNDNKTTIYISNITYEGKIDENKYKEIKCTLYEKDNGKKNIISTYDYNEKEILLSDFLKQVNFNINHYANNCRMYEDGALCLEIDAINNENGTVHYKIPLKSEDNCD